MWSYGEVRLQACLSLPLDQNCRDVVLKKRAFSVFGIRLNAWLTYHHLSLIALEQ